MKKYKVKNSYHGNVELVYGEKTFLMHEGEEKILTEEQFQSIPKHKKYLLDGFLTVIEIKEEQKTIKK